MTTTQQSAYHAPMHETAAEVAPDMQKPREPTPLAEWRALWALEDGQPAWFRSAAARMDGYIQGQLGHS